MNRRGFFSRLAALAVAPTAVRLVPMRRAVRMVSLKYVLVARGYDENYFPFVAIPWSETQPKVVK